MFGSQTIYEKVGIPANAVSDDMANAIDKWCDLYENSPPWLTNDLRSLSLPSRIASEIATMVTVEMEFKVVPVGDNKQMAEYLQEQILYIIDDIRKQTEYACAKGGLVFKPYVDNDKVCYDFVQADDFYPCAFNSKDEITSAAFLSRKKDGTDYFTRVEKHTWEDTHYSIVNMAFRSKDADDIGDQCSLEDIDEWADIDPVVLLENVECPLFAYFKIPLGNTIDPKSPLGVSVYARVHQAGLLREADIQFQRLMWEYEGGELAIDASKDAFKLRNGEPELPTGKERLYRMNVLETSDGKKLFDTFSPNLRDEAYGRGLNTVLKQIEDGCGLSRGCLSDPENTVRTATEIKMAKQRTYATVSSIQGSLEAALTTLVQASATLATLYNLAPAGEYELSFTWDDSVIVDAETERQRDLEEVASGIMQRWEYRKRWYGEDDATAKAMAAAANNAMSDDALMGFKLQEPEA